jgi:alcohol dehydrogenase (cytochrome c)
MKRVLCAVAVMMLAAIATGPKGPALQAQSGITFDRILKARGEPHNWLTYSGDVMGQRYSPLTQITPANVKNLELQWIFQANSLEKFEATPLAVDGVLYTVQPPNDVIALDGATGRIFWTYSHVPSNQTRPCCGRVNRGVAILGDSLFMATLDGFLIALDAKSGRQQWKVKVEGARPEAGYAFTVAPLVVKDKVIVGPAGGDFGIRGWLAAYDALTGKEVWRFHTIPGPGEPGNTTWAGESWKTGGAAICTTGTYDPETNLTFWGTGNPGPDWNGDSRMGDNLYADSVVALDADTGRLKWHFQFTPHDEFDYDSTQVPVLADVQLQGRTRKAMLFANRNGFWYVLDRVTGEFLSGKPFTRVTWTSGLDAKGRPMNQVSPTAAGTRVYPHLAGGTNWYSPSYSPRTGLLYVPAWMDTSANFIKGPAEYVEGRPFIGTFPNGSTLTIIGNAINRRLPEEGYGAIIALDPRTGERAWMFKMDDVTDAGVLSTATDLVFSGGREGFFFALDAKTGQPLWKANVGGFVQAGPMSYAIGTKQYIAIAAGHSLFTYALRQ